MQVFGRYVLLQVPGWLLAGIILYALEKQFDLPPWTVIGVMAVLLAKDFLLYPFLRRAYETQVKSGADALIGLTGVARERLDPAGYVELRGELWLAEAAPEARPIAPNERVRVVAADGLRLRVTRLEASLGS
jgi:membrane-bound serine protease (ClpP class)